MDELREHQMNSLVSRRRRRCTLTSKTNYSKSILVFAHLNSHFAVVVCGAMWIYISVMGIFAR